MSHDEPDAEATVDSLDEDAPADEILEKVGLEPPDEELEDEELVVGGLVDLEIDDVDLGNLPFDDSGDAGDDADDSADDSAGDDADLPAPREVPAGVRPDDDDDEDDEDEELEADLGEILKERLASEDDDEDDEDDDIRIVPGSRSTSKQEDEILCEGCFLLVMPSQFDARSLDPICPHCGTPIAI